LWVEINAVEENVEFSELKEEIEKHVVCECGKLLIGMFAYQAYNRSPVICNVCNKQSSSNQIIYHCPENRNQVHNEGYDMCSNCVELVMPSSVTEKLDKNAQQNESDKKIDNSNNNYNDKSDNIKNINNNVQQDKENKNDEFVQIPPIISVINENENNNQKNNASPKNSEPEIVEMEDISDNENDSNKKQQDEDDSFEFKTQLNSLKEMGFNDIASLKFLLVKFKGDVQLVVQELLAQI